MTNHHTLLRIFKENDIERIVHLASDLGLSHWSEKDYVAESSRADSHLKVAVREKEIIGFIVGRRIPGNGHEKAVDAEIYNIGVAEREQRHGVGDLLLSDFLESNRRSNVENIWLEVRSKNAKAIAFYEKHGFEYFAARPKFYQGPSDDGIIMKLSLK